MNEVEEITSDEPVFNLDLPISTLTGLEYDAGFTDLVQRHSRVINDREKVGSYSTITNVRLSPNYTYRELKGLLTNLYNSQSGHYKINIGFGCILKNRGSGEFRYYYCSNNTMLFNVAFRISSRTASNTFFQNIVDEDLIGHYYEQRPSTNWIFAGFTNMEIHTYKLPRLGAPVALPDHILKSCSIWALTYDETNKRPYDDNFCLFRCLALHFGANFRSLAAPTKRLVKQFTDEYGINAAEGVSIDDLELVELCFKVGINVYSLQASGRGRNAEMVRMSKTPYPVMRVNIYENHLSYIHNFDVYAKQFTCIKCGRILSQTCNLARHVKTCVPGTEEIYRGGKYRVGKTVFQSLEEEGIEVPSSLRVGNIFSVYDLEALQIPTDELNRGRSVCCNHVAATASVCLSLIHI